MILSARFCITTFLLTLTALVGCASGPDYRKPEIVTPASYKEIQGWKIAEPQDEKLRGNWWALYRDTELNTLVEQVRISNQNIRAAEARHRQALAILDASRGGYYPALAASASAGRGRTGSSTAAVPANRVALNASWEPDLWGRIGRTVETNQALVQASSADLQAALLSAQATLVQTYMQLRLNDAQRRLLDQTMTAFQRSLDITRNRFEAGVAARLDVAQAETQLKSTQAQQIDLGVQRAQLEHAIALLVGQAPVNFALPPTYALPETPQIPIVIPSVLLERRPDIAAAERRTAAANAQIGVAQAAFFPSLTLSATGGFQSSSLAQLFSLPNRFWSIGPVLAATLFDAGTRSAVKNQAIAGYDQTVAEYRQTVLSAFQDVEDNLSALHILALESTVQQQAAQLARESLELTNNQYQAGTISYLNVVTAQVTALNSDLASLDIDGRRLLASAALLKSLGGSWAPDLAK
jgi:NodT family efflux transporter outer membrane factor (OMF) lipoprotein